MQQRHILNRMLGVAVLAMLFGASSAQGQSGTSDAEQQGMQQSGSSGTSGSASAGKQEGSKSLSKADQDLLRDLTQSNLAEIEAGKIALSQSKNEQVRTFAQKMIDDHQQAQKDIEQLAQAKGMTLPTEPDNKHKSAIKKLSAMEGDKFDKQYMKQGGLSDHSDAHRLLQRAQSRANDPELKALAAKMEPIVSQHLTLAKDVSSAKSTASGSSQGPAGTSASGPGSSGASSPATSGSGKSGATGTPAPSDTTSPGK